MTTERFEVCPENLERLRGARGWLNVTGDNSFFSILAITKENPELSDVYTYGDFIEIIDGVAYGIRGEKPLVNDKDKPVGTVKAKLRAQALQIAEWHENTFDTTVEGQRAKFEEEKKELAEAQALNRTDKVWEEKADCFIVAAALAYRWHDKAGQEYLDAAEQSDDAGRLLDAVVEKMAVNIERTKAGLWKKQKDGSFHH